MVEMKMSRAWAMPSPWTFSIPPIDEFVTRWAEGVVVDPFAASSGRASHSNDLDPDAPTDFHLEAGEYCAVLAAHGVVADAVLFDPPYSPHQISTQYKRIGLEVGVEEAQNGRLYKRVRDGLDVLLRPGGIALSFGWNSAGFGKTRGYEIQEILLVAHGGAHNDTICVAERKP